MAHFLSEAVNFLALPEESSSPERAGVVVILVRFEATSTYGTGTARGPEAIIHASHQVELFDAALGFEPYRATGGIATRAPLDVAGCDGETVAQRVREAVARQLAEGKFVVVLGGEHTAVVGAIQAHCAAFDDLTVLQLDAHSDLRPTYYGSPWNHACAMARVLDFHRAVVQVGIRSQALEERRIAEAHGLPVFYAHDIHGHEDRGEHWVTGVIAATTPRVYVTLDCDVFDPAVVPATGTPEPDGLTWRQVDRLLARLCAEREVVGLDVSELAPIPGVQHAEFTIAKLIYRFIGHRFGAPQH